MLSSVFLLASLYFAFLFSIVLSLHTLNEFGKGLWSSKAWEVVICACLIGFETKRKTSKDKESSRHRVGYLCKHHGPSTRGSEFSTRSRGPHIVPLLPNFHGMESENPYAHIKEFEEVCNTFREGGASIDLMRLKLFPFTLKDKAKIWLNSLRPRSIRNWVDLQAEFLKKFFPTHRTNGLKRQISNFSAKENEKFHECWERYMEAINACPHHGFDTWLLVSYFMMATRSVASNQLRLRAPGSVDGAEDGVGEGSGEITGYCSVKSMGSELWTLALFCRRRPPDLVR
ncbi:hypothetical protein CK203_060842 [Vitis vinifera]|uniref:Retrotransposon gag domain-containing protein n=1 Tax=Vitis vinifera TaxID=29760 RepID=A0A438FUA7_VITVI|nr:hypothetical protein CK203_060842 [Vitis vinifera]